MQPNELIIRNLADLLFSIRDYEQANYFYKLCMEEFKNKSHKHYANACEMSVYSSVLHYIEQG